jgi:hypothetical protein
MSKIVSEEGDSFGKSPNLHQRSKTVNFDKNPRKMTMDADAKSEDSEFSSSGSVDLNTRINREEVKE